MRFIDLFAGLGGFHRALTALNHECVFASEIDDELRALYELNFPDARGHVYGNIRRSHRNVPPHDILCAGFPCQPFSKSGEQLGSRDKTRGTLFNEILKILRRHHPPYVLLENVGNFERHDSGRTWQIVKGELQGLGYHVLGTEHRASGGEGLISPHHLGFPHQRERFFVVATLHGPVEWPALDRSPNPRVLGDALEAVLEPEDAISTRERPEIRLTEQQVACIDHWNEFLQRLPPDLALPSFPIWGDELWHEYPTKGTAPRYAQLRVLQRSLRRHGHPVPKTRREALEHLPAYARRDEKVFPHWKRRFIEDNREFWRRVRPALSLEWIRQLRAFPPSLRKLEWNCQGEERDLWRHILQFRPSGLRVKRASAVPALVAMTVTQIPVIGPRRRFITRTEGLRLLGFPDDHALPLRRTDAFRALGNAVHVGVVTSLAEAMLRVRPEAPRARSGAQLVKVS